MDHIIKLYKILDLLKTCCNKLLINMTIAWA